MEITKELNSALDNLEISEESKKQILNLANGVIAIEKLNKQAGLPLKSHVIKDEDLREILQKCGEGFDRIFCCYSIYPNGHNSPTFEKVESAYNEEAAKFYLIYHIEEALWFIGILDETPASNIYEAARLMLLQFKNITLNNFLSRVNEIKLGKYGKITSLHEFCSALCQG